MLILPLGILIGIAYADRNPVIMAIEPLRDMNIMPTLGVMMIATVLVERFLEVLVGIVRTQEPKDASYKKGTKQFALWVSYAVGLAVSLAGVRMLTPLLDVAFVSGAHSVIFSYVDTLLTAGLLSAGTQGVHQLNKAFSTLVGRAQIQSDVKSSNQ